MKNKRHFRSYDPNQSTLMPPSLHDWLPKGHLAYFVRETVEALDLSAILDTYDSSRGGYPAYHPLMMTQLLDNVRQLGVACRILLPHPAPLPRGATVARSPGGRPVLDRTG